GVPSHFQLADVLGAFTPRDPIQRNCFPLTLSNLLEFQYIFDRLSISGNHRRVPINGETAISVDRRGSDRVHASIRIQVSGIWTGKRPRFVKSIVDYHEAPYRAISAPRSTRINDPAFYCYFLSRRRRHRMVGHKESPSKYDLKCGELPRHSNWVRLD